jgi:hypothetical protein
MERPGTTASFAAYQRELVAADIKEVVARVSDAAFVEAENTNIPTVTYEVGASAARRAMPACSHACNATHSLGCTAAASVVTQACACASTSALMHSWCLLALCCGTQYMSAGTHLPC